MARSSSTLLERLWLSMEQDRIRVRLWIQA
jgi:hypothetical protein